VYSVGLDVYVGPLTRYFLGSWENDVAQMLATGTAEVGGQPQESVRALEVKTNTRLLEVRTAREAAATIGEWRTQISHGLGLETALDWPESDKLHYYTRKVTWDGYTGLLQWAADEEAGQTPPPEVPEHEDVSVPQRSRAGAKTSRYPHLLGETNLWLPGDHDVTFRAPDPTGTRIDIGFAGPLFGELIELNRRTWQADGTTIQEWYDGSVENGAPVEACAQFGFAVFYRLSGVAYKEGLPMILDH
jgi:hypothetical protein